MASASHRVNPTPMPNVPFLDLRAQFHSIRAEVLAAVLAVLESQEFSLGIEVETFEREMSRFVGCKFAVGCASGADALLLSLTALEIGARDEVITTPFTSPEAASAIARVGARPVFVDVRPNDFSLDSKQVSKAITPRTRAILPVHIFGFPAEMDSIMEIALAHRLAVIEDAAHAIGARHSGRSVGSLGTAGCFSFLPSENLGGAGDGGLVTTQDPEVAGRLRVLRGHGSRSEDTCDLLGLDSRLDALQAAILNVKLRYLDEWNGARQRNADGYRLLFHEFGLDTIVLLPLATADRRHVYNQFVIRAPRRNELREFLHSQGIPTEVCYPRPLHLQPAFSYLEYRKGDFPHAEAASAEMLALPIYPEVTSQQQQQIVSRIARFFAQ